MGADVVGVDRDRFVLAVGGRERDFVQQFFHYGVEPPRPEVLDVRVHLGSEARQLVDGLFRELERHAFGSHERRVLFDEAVLRLPEDAPEIFLGERLQLDPDGQPALQLRRAARPRG